MLFILITMRTITLQKMTMLNFKGIRKMDIDFGVSTEIHGNNGTGKTTVFDAFVWCLFGKDSSDRKDFEVKTLDAKGKALSKLNHEVEINLLVDSVVVTLKRVYTEKWTTKRGSNEAVFSGHETAFYWNEVPMSQNEYNQKVSDILNESVFKMITSPTFFNQSMKWQDRRDILLKIAGEVSDADIAGTNENYLAILAELTQGKTLEQYKAQVKAQVSKMKEELKSIPTRIDESERQRVTGVDFNVLRSNVADVQKQLDKVNDQLTNINNAFKAVLEANKEKMISVSRLEAKLTSIREAVNSQIITRLTPDTSELSKLQNERNQKQQEVNSLLSNKVFFENQISGYEKSIAELDAKIKAKREEYNTENDTVFSDVLDNSCPTCKQQLPAEQLESKQELLLKNFNTLKASRLANIQKDGKALAESIENAKGLLESNRKNLEEVNSKLEPAKNELQKIVEKIDAYNAGAKNEMPEQSEIEAILETELLSNEEYIKTQLELEAVKSEIQETPEVDNSELEAKRGELTEKLNNLNADLAKESINTQIDSRVAELQQTEKEYSQKINDVDRILFNIENFEKDKILKNEELVNSKFKLVKFKMFNEQINGGYEPTCVATINGVPFSDANTASKINAGLDIINTLCEFYGVTAPVFIDNRESVVKLIESDSQIISLVVNPNFKELTVHQLELVV